MAYDLKDFKGPLIFKTILIDINSVYVNELF